MVNIAGCPIPSAKRREIRRPAQTGIPVRCEFRGPAHNKPTHAQQGIAVSSRVIPLMRPFAPSPLAREGRGEGANRRIRTARVAKSEFSKTIALGVPRTKTRDGFRMALYYTSVPFASENWASANAANPLSSKNSMFWYRDSWTNVRRLRDLE